MRNDADKIYDETRICAFIGTRFAVGDRDKMSTRMATLGGSIMHGEIFFGVTVARRFTEHPYDEFSDEEESDMSDDDSEATEIISCPESTQPIMLEFDLRLRGRSTIPTKNDLMLGPGAIAAKVLLAII